MNFFKRLYEKQVDAMGLALFRIAYSAVLFCEVAQLFYFRHLVFDRIPFMDPGEMDPTYALLAWLTTLVFLMLGLFTTSASILNYVLSLVFIATINNYEYNMFYVYMGVNFLLMFTNSAKTISLDRLRAKLADPRVMPNSEWDNRVSVLNYYVILLVSVAFVYVDSVFWKFMSDNWMTGIGMWAPASLVYMTYFDLSPVLNTKWLALGLGYLTFAFEIVFIFLFFRRKWRLILFVIGVGLHLGIALVFPIPWFGLGVTAIYLLLFPLSFWRRIHSALSFKTPRLTLSYPEACEVCRRLVMVLQHFDWLNAISFQAASKSNEDSHPLQLTRRDGSQENGIDALSEALKYMPLFFFAGWLIRLPLLRTAARGLCHFIEGTTFHSGAQPVQDLKTSKFGIFHKVSLKSAKRTFAAMGILILVALQVNSSYHSPLIVKALVAIGVEDTPLNKRLREKSSAVREKSKALFGITNHPVFLDGHFAGYNHVIAIRAVGADSTRIWLPIVDETGQPDYYNYGFGFVKWTYRVNSTIINRSILTTGVRDFTTFWAVKNNCNIEELKFEIMVKKIDIPTSWEKDVLTTQKRAAWKKCGEARWRGGVFEATFADIESL